MVALTVQFEAQGSLVERKECFAQRVYLPAILDRRRSTLPFLTKLKRGDVECIVTLSNDEGERATRTNCS